MLRISHYRERWPIISTHASHVDFRLSDNECGRTCSTQHVKGTLTQHVKGTTNSSVQMTSSRVRLGQSFKTVAYGYASCWADVGAGNVETDVFYIPFIVSVQYIGY